MTAACVKLPEELLARMAETLKLLGHPKRLRILEHLDLQGEQGVNEIVTALECAQSEISQHLNQMRRRGLLSSRREKRQVLYRIADVHALTILNCIRQKHLKN